MDDKDEILKNVFQGFWTRIGKERTRSGSWTQRRFSFQNLVKTINLDDTQELYSDGKQTLENCVAEKRRYDSFLQVGTDLQNAV